MEDGIEYVVALISLMTYLLIFFTYSVSMGIEGELLYAAELNG